MDAKPRLLDQVREQIRLKHYSYRTEKQHVGWVRRYILSHQRRHPESMGAGEVERLPVVLSREEVRSILSGMEGTPWLVASLLENIEREGITL